MRIKGQLVQWDEAKGYGFIQPEGEGGRIFVHAKAFGLRARRPFVGERLSYEPGRDAQGKARALKVQSLEPKPAPSTVGRAASKTTGAPSAGGSGDAVLWLIPAFASLVLLCALAWPVPNALWGVYVAMSLATFIVYAGDKRAAQKNGWRVAEGTLHGLALACGWPGALLAQQLLRHKSVKQPFRRRFWLTVALNILAFTLLFTPLGSRLLHEVLRHV
ncbi:cold shock and DUF1294 domain-containing protein [Paucibacter sp. APW11]|uniref:Cold shock and DUF1294 domain-containing protein n=1 Tax=Roseateles aquae TaxID=3077235 RepID=A0ABU3P6B0_9BURK|nr:cold shock and DUF1294 domain-containing protein [Paucibacter sp. APW11]MDT8998106.1 cold shock and DUF1294 domain-containing protein [Paucibacter sp. APW11]